MDYITIDGRDYPYKLTNRAKIRLQKQHKVDFKGGDISFEHMSLVALEALKEGATIEKDEANFKLNLPALLDYDAEADTSIIDTIIKRIGERAGETDEAAKEGND